MARPTTSRSGFEPIVRKRNLRDHIQDAEDVAYWLSRPVEERLAAVEALRRDYYGKDYATEPGLPRSAWPVERRPLKDL